MKKTPLFILILAFLVFSLAGIAHSWQGRMAGMGDPYGLIKDESDFLIHPAGIAKGEGVKFYGFYRFNWRDVRDWDYKYNARDITGVDNARWPFKAWGHEWQHEGLLGAALPLGPGRMGLFLEYKGKKGDYDGNLKEFYNGVFSYFDKYNMESDLDNFALRLLYGLPMREFKLGGEIQLAYRREKNETFYNYDWDGLGTRAFYINFPLGGTGDLRNLFQYIIPYDSKYLEALLKGSLKGDIGLARLTLTVYGGLIFWGDNKYKAYANEPGGLGLINTSGDVNGWNIGSDFWLRFPLSKDLSLPFLVKINYQDKTRDASGFGTGAMLGFPVSGIGDYKNREKNLLIEAGAGLDKELNKGTRIATGVYYNYLKNKNDFKGQGIDTTTGFLEIIDYTNYPDQTEHRVILKIVGEKEISPMFAMRMGLNFFYGWVKEDFEFNFSNSSPASGTNKIPLDGYRWGLGAWLGGTVRFNRINIEPFLGGGYQRLKLNGDGINTNSYYIFREVDKIRKDWSIGGGLSVKF